MTTELHEPVFELDDFQRPKMLEGWEGMVFVVLVVLFGKPGFYPSIPELGMNIQQYRNRLMDSIEEEQLQASLVYQCSKLRDDLLNDGLTITKRYYQNQGAIIISIPIIQERKKLIIGLRGEDDGVSFNYGLFDLNELNI